MNTLTVFEALEMLKPFGEGVPYDLMTHVYNKIGFGASYKFKKLAACNRTANAKWLIDEGWGVYHTQALDLFKFKTLSVDDKFQILKNYIDRRILTKPTTSENEEKGVRIEGLDVLISNSPDFTEEFMAEHFNELLEYFSKDDLKLVFRSARGKPIKNEKLLLLFEIL